MSEPSAVEDCEPAPDPTRSEARLRAPAETPLPRANRHSVRASAFGPPRPSAPPPRAPAIDAEAGAAEEGAAKAGRAEARAPLPALVQSDAAPVTLAPPEPHAQLQPPQFAGALGSLRPDWREGLRARARRPLFSVALFCSMLALSGVTLLRYAVPGWRAATPVAASGRSQLEEPPAPQGASALAPQPRAAQPEPRVAEPAPSIDPAAQLADQILSLRMRGELALARGNTREAEELFTRILQLEEGNARAAYGIARVRLSQGELGEAERWIRLAIAKRPRRAPYHAFYAQILMELGRQDEALEERLRAAGETEQE